MPPRKPETEEEHQRRLEVAFATWKAARVSKKDEGFLLSLENGTLDDEVMHINTGDEARDLRLIGFAISSRGVRELYCSGRLSIRPFGPVGNLPPDPEGTFEEEVPANPEIEAFLARNRLLFG